MGRVPVGDAEVAYEVQGDGAPAMLLHSTGGSRLGWALQLPLLTRRWQVVLPEFSGSGETVDDGRSIELDDLVAQAAATADDLGLESYHVAGYSLGAVVGLALAASRPQRVRSLAVVCGWVTSDARMRFQFDAWRRLFTADPELLVRHLFIDGFTAELLERLGDGIEALVAGVTAQLAPGTDRHAELDAGIDVAARLGAITAPTLVVAGRRDRVTPVEHSRRLADAVAGAELVELDYGHLLPLEAGEELAVVLDAFFAEHDHLSGRASR